MKKDIAPMQPVLPFILSLKAYSFRFMDNKPEDPKSIGFIAQDVMAQFPELIVECPDKVSGERLYGLKYSQFSVLAIKAIQEQQEIIEDQQHQIDALKEEIQQIRQLLTNQK
jgi:hypothetical protein